MAAPMSKKHHERLELCTTRAKYREGRDLKAVKVYTVSNESKYLLVQGVPAVRVQDDLLKMFALYGTIEEYRVLAEYPREEFTEVLWIKFQRIQAARIAKRKLDDQSFYGGVLHVCYAPEYETVQDTREKLQDRRKAIATRLRKLETEVTQASGGGDKPTPTTSTLASSQEWAYSKHQSREGSAEMMLPLALPERLPPSTGAPPTSGPGDYNYSQNGASVQMADIGDPSVMYPALPYPPQHLPPWLHPNPRQSFHSSTSVTHRGSDPTSQPAPSTPLPRHTTSHTMDTSRLHKDAKDVKNTESGRQADHRVVDGLIIKKPPLPKAPPKFVPRQVSQVKKPYRLKHLLKPPTHNSESTLPTDPVSATKKDEDEVNAALKRQAFVLRDVEGPVLPPDKDNKSTAVGSTVTGNQSIDQTVVEIRKRVREFSTVAPPPQLRKKKR